MARVVFSGRMEFMVRIVWVFRMRLAAASSTGCLTGLRDGLLRLPCLLRFTLDASYPALDITSGADQILRKRDFLQASVTGAPRSEEKGGRKGGQIFRCLKSGGDQDEVS